MTRRVEIRNIEIGMFVAELDRPWLDSPFLFQGFLIESEEELGKLQETCEYVFIDEERSAPPQDRRAVPGGLAKIVRPRTPAPQARSTTLITSVNQTPTEFKESFRATSAAHQRTQLGVIKILDDRRLGKLVQTEPVRAAVSGLMQSILKNPSAALWLTKLRSEDEFTAAHSLNVAILSIAFAQHLGLPQKQMEAIGLGAILHDVGLTEAASEIIRKKASLTPEEFAIVRRHPVDGVFSLKDAENLDQVTLDVIRWHHERIDGSGYPDALSGDDIPMHVRVVIVADMYDSMASDRAYRRGLLPSDVLSVLYKHAEKTVGSGLVESFIQCVGIYPVGSVVQLNTGAIAMVASSDPGFRLTPLVLLLKDPEGRPYLPRRMVDLSTTEQKTGLKWSIKRMVSPADHQIDIAAIAADEMRAFQ